MPRPLRFPTLWTWRIVPHIGPSWVGLRNHLAFARYETLTKKHNDLTVVRTTICSSGS